MEFDEGELPLERFAAILAHVVHFGGDRAEEVRRRLGVDPAVWEAAEVHWVDALDRDARGPAPDRAPIFGRVFRSGIRRRPSSC